jgi:hypothetical protein
MNHFYDMQQVAGDALQSLLAWQDDSLPWDIFLLYPPGIVWSENWPQPTAWFHQREEANPTHYRTGPDLTEALQASLDGI